MQRGIVALLLGLTCVCACAQTVRLRTVQQSGSVVKYDPGGDPQRPGLCLEILQAVARLEPGLSFDGLAQRVPLKRVERLLAEQQIDVFFCLLRSPGRERQWRYVPVPLYTIRHVAVQRADDPRPLNTLADLAALSRDKPVVVTRGTVLQEGLRAAGVRVVEVSSEHEALQMLVLGRADAVYGQDINLLRHLAGHPQAGRLRLGPTAFVEESQFLTLRSDLPAAVRERLTQALRQLDQNGTLKTLAEKYRR